MSANFWSEATLSEVRQENAVTCATIEMMMRESQAVAAERQTLVTKLGIGSNSQDKQGVHHKRHVLLEKL
jgi:hypothetical protein